MTEYPQEAEGNALRQWFTEPPYWGLWIVAGFVLGLVIAAVALQPRRTAEAPQVVVQAPSAPAQAPRVQVQPEPEEETPQVTVRSLPGANAPANTPANAPASNAPAANAPANSPANAPAAVPPGAPLPGSVVPGAPVPAVPEVLPVPEPPAPVPVPEPAPRREPEVVIPPAPVETPRPRPRARVPRSEPVPVPRQDSGRVTVFFDADSSTFDRRGQRLPLRVEVYVDGEKRVESADPEKREFNLGRLPEGDHDIEIVPYVGNLPAESRRERVRVRARDRNEFKAVMRREDGRSRISKFRERD